MADNLGTLKVKPTDAAGVNEATIDTHGSQQIQIADAAGNAFGTPSNPIYTETTLASSSANVGTVGIDQTGSANGVQVASGPGTSSGNPLYVSTTTGASGTPVFTYVTLSNLTNGTPQTATGTLITSGKKGYLANIYASSQVAASFLVQTVDSSNTATNVFTLMTAASAPTTNFGPLTQLEVSTATGEAVNVKFQVVANNLDNTPSDAHVWIAWLEN